MRNQRVLEMTTLALFGAIIFVMAFVPQLGFISFGVIALTIIHIPVLIGGWFGGRRVAVGLGLMFGLASISQAFLRPVAVTDIFFQNPFVSVLPRLGFGFAIVGLHLGLKRWIRSEFLLVSLTFALATFLHTVMVLGSIFVFAPFFTLLNDFASSTPFFPFIWSVLVSNGFFEIAAALLIGAPIAHRLRKANPFHSEA